MNHNIIPDFDKTIKPTEQQLLILKNIRNCNKIIDYLNLRINKETTKRAFATYIRDYFIYLKIVNVNDYFKDPRKIETNNDKIDYTDKIEKDIENSNSYLKKYSGSRRLSSLSAIRKLLEFNKIDLGNDFWTGIRKAGPNAYRETEIITPTREQLRNILSRADNEAKAFFLMQMTSGSRVEEIRTLTFDNLFLDTNPPSFKVTKEHSKTGRQITKFFSDEALYYLKEYLDKDRTKIIKTRINRARNYESKIKYNGLIFPMGKTNIELIWNNLCKKEGLYQIDPKTNHPIMGTHSLRRFFEDNIGNGKLSQYMLNKLSKSEEPYSFKTKNKIEETYLNYMDNLYIFETPKKTKEELENLKDKLSKKDKEIETLRSSVNLINKGRKSFEERYNQYDKRFKQIEEKLNISLNPKTPETENLINYFKNFIKPVFKKKLGREPTEEELNKELKIYDKLAPQILGILSNMPKNNEFFKKVSAENLMNLINSEEKKLRKEKPTHKAIKTQ